MTQVHGTVVAFSGRGVLLLGPSGAGKSTVALQMMSAGAALVADDCTDLALKDGQVIASCPPQIAGRIEARGVGILNAAPHAPVPVALVVDLGRVEEDRLPQSRSHELLGVSLPLVLGPYRPHLYAALRQFLIGGRAA